MVGLLAVSIAEGSTVPSCGSWECVPRMANFRLCVTRLMIMIEMMVVPLECQYEAGGVLLNLPGVPKHHSQSQPVLLRELLLRDPCDSCESPHRSPAARAQRLVATETPSFTGEFACTIDPMPNARADG